MMNHWRGWGWQGDLYVRNYQYREADLTVPCISEHKGQYYVSQPFENSFHPAWHYAGPFESMDTAKAAYLLMFDNALDMR